MSVEFMANVQIKSNFSQFYLCINDYLFGTKSFKQQNEIIEDNIIDRDVPKPFNILSAYLITAATTNPPIA